MRREPDFAVDCVAERVGFEPTVPFGTTVFETLKSKNQREKNPPRNQTILLINQQNLILPKIAPRCIECGGVA